MAFSSAREWAETLFPQGLSAVLGPVHEALSGSSTRSATEQPPPDRERAAAQSLPPTTTAPAPAAVAEAAAAAAPAPSTPLPELGDGAPHSLLTTTLQFRRPDRREQHAFLQELVASDDDNTQPASAPLDVAGVHLVYEDELSASELQDVEDERECCPGRAAHAQAHTHTTHAYANPPYPEPAPDHDASTAARGAAPHPPPPLSSSSSPQLPPISSAASASLSSCALSTCGCRSSSARLKAR